MNSFAAFHLELSNGMLFILLERVQLLDRLRQESQSTPDARISSTKIFKNLKIGYPYEKHLTASAPVLIHKIEISFLKQRIFATT